MREPVIVDADGGASEAWRQCADVLYGSRPRPAEAASAWPGRLLRRYPGCLLAAAARTDGGCALAVRGGTPTVLPGPDGTGPGRTVTDSAGPAGPGPDGTGPDGTRLADTGLADTGPGRTVADGMTPLLSFWYAFLVGAAREISAAPDRVGADGPGSARRPRR
ncbi:hypothetical protein [Streptomyces sp. NPDC050504]|uniref:hypothetical protein n=1 Tax=Streptomyces sp. NPDC050504 TaxID=3365618 RepID=UPI0037932549